MRLLLFGFPVRAALAVLVLASTLSLASPPKLRAAEPAPSLDEVVESDADVQRAREELERAARQRDAVSSSLDEAAGAYESARGQAERLADEAQQLADERSDTAQRLDADRDAERERVVRTWRDPMRRMGLAELVLGAPEASTALHLAGMLGHLGSRADAEIARLDHVDRLGADNVRSQVLVTAGAEQAADEARRTAGRLQAALDEARTIVRRADVVLTTAKADAREAEEERRRQEAERRRQEAERRRQEAARRAREASAVAVEGAAPPPAVGGKVCPIGSPNGFIDSWGFPRSGGRRHQGIDIFAAYGTPVFAVADGVVDVGSNRLGGLVVRLFSDEGDRYYYAHLASQSVTDGQRVQAGDVLGGTGTSGNAAGTPPHLHWQFHPGDGAPVNPYPLAVALCR